MKRLVLAVLVGAFALVVSIAWIVQTRVAFRRAAANACDGMESIFANLEYQPEPELCRFARELTVEWGDVMTAAKADCAATASRLHIDQVSVIGTNGIVLASSDPTLVGFDFASNPNTAEFLGLNAGKHYVTQPFRRPVNRPDAPLMKFVGISFPNGGFVQIGDAIHPDDGEKRDYILVQSMQAEHIADDGYYTIVDEKKDLVLSTFLKENTGVKASAAGFPALDFGSGDGPAVGVVFGKKSIVWRAHPAFFDVIAYVTFPLDSITHTRNVSVGMVALMLFVLFSVGYAFFLKINSQSIRLREQNLKMEAFYAKEEADRQRDLALAKSIQSSALPSVFPPYPERREFDLYAKMRTAKEVGGDFYDFFLMGSNQLCLVIADVSGKGVPAALFMMRSRAIIKSCVTTMPDLATALSTANDRLCDNNAAEMFVTAWVGVLDFETGDLKSVSAGHNPPVIRRADGTVEMLTARPSLVLAAMEGTVYREESTQLRPGDRLLLYTDGVTEATSLTGELFGNERLMATMSRLSGDATVGCGQVFAAVDAFAGETPQADDITMLLLGYKGIVGTVTRTFPASLEGLAHATQFLQRRLDAGDCAEKTKAAMMVAIDEIASNIVRYSGAPDFTVQVVFDDESVRVIFSDAGKEFNPLAKEDPDVTLSITERAIGGLGLFMVKRMMDEVSYDYVDGRNVLTLRKSRA